MSAPLAERGFLGIGLLLAALSLALAAANLFAADDVWVVEKLGRIGAVTIGLIPALVILAGLGLRTRSPATGLALTFVGAIGFAIMMWWTILVPLLALLLVYCTFVRPGRLRSEP